MSILGFGKKDDDPFSGKRKDDDMSKYKEIDRDDVPDKRHYDSTENSIDDNYIDKDDIDYCDYGDIVDTIEEMGWSLVSSVGVCPLTHINTDIVHTKHVNRNTYDAVMEIICPPGKLITICGFNQEDIDKEEFFNSPNLCTRPHCFSLRFTDDDNSEISCTTIIGISKIARDGVIEKLYEEFYGDLSPIIDGRLKKKEDRYYFAETMILQNGDKLVFNAYWPNIDITKVELLMMTDMFTISQ